MYKTFEELKEELGDKYDRFMYDMNLELVKQKEKAIEYIKLRKQICERQENTTGMNILVELENILRGNNDI